MALRVNLIVTISPSYIVWFSDGNSIYEELFSSNSTTFVLKSGLIEGPLE